MILTEANNLNEQLEYHVRWRTARRVRELTITCTPERVVISGRTTSFYVKQLAQHGIRDLLPQVELENSIIVEDAEAVAAA